MNAKTVLLVVAGMGLLFIMGVGSCIGMLFVGYRNIDKSLSPTIDDLVGQMNGDTFEATYDTHTTAEFQKATSREAYVALGRKVKARLGNLQSKSMRQFNLRYNNGRQTANVVFAAEFEKGSGSIAGQFEKVGDQWLVLNLNITSLEFEKDVAAGNCSKCNAPHSAGARYCQSCGKLLAEEIKVDL